MNTKDDKQPEVFNYLNYRDFLRDLTAYLKAAKQFNLRQFAKKADIKAPGYLKMVIDGKRQLTLETIHKFCQALAITGKEKIYFEKLVLYNQAKDPDIKKSYYDDLMMLKPRSSYSLLEKNRARYFSRPYYVCVREMVTLADFKEDPKWIAKRCFPKIKPSEAEEAIETLIELGLLTRNKKGKLIQTENFVHTQDKNNQAVQTYHFHEAMINKARHALSRLPQEERNYYALTLPLSKKLFNEMVQDFYTFRDQLVQKVEDANEDFDEVYQINFQLFPITKKEGSS